MSDEIESMVLSLGFASKQEFDQLITNVDLSTNARKKAFKNWQYYDCTKDGLLKLSEAEYPEPILKYRMKTKYKTLLWTQAYELYNYRNNTNYTFDDFFDKIVADETFCTEFDDLTEEVSNYAMLLRSNSEENYKKALEMKKTKYACLDSYLELVEDKYN